MTERALESRIKDLERALETERSLRVAAERLARAEAAAAAILRANARKFAKAIHPHVEERLHVRYRPAGAYVTVVGERGADDQSLISADQVVSHVLAQPDFSGIAHDNQRAGSGTPPNPWAKGTLNVTEQAGILKASPRLAAWLRRIARSHQDT